jgi:hypothetical protein
LLEAIVVVYWHLLFLFFFGRVIFLSFRIVDARRLVIFSELKLNLFFKNKADSIV